MNGDPAARFALTAGELHAVASGIPGSVLPSFVSRDGGRSAALATADAHDRRLRLALGLHGAAHGVIHTVSWSRAELIRRSIVLAGAVAASVSRRDALTDGDRPELSSVYEVALLPAAAVGAEVASSVPEVGVDGASGRGARHVGVAVSRAIVEAERLGDPVLLDDVAADCSVDAETVAALRGLGARQPVGFRLRCFDARTGRCIGGDDWFGSQSGWRRVRLSLPPHPSGVSAERLLDDGIVSVSVATDTEIRRSLLWSVATLFRVIAR